MTRRGLLRCPAGGYLSNKDRLQASDFVGFLALTRVFIPWFFAYSAGITQTQWRILRVKAKEGILLFSHESDILRKIRLIEWLKAELVTHVGQLYQAIAKNSDALIREALAAVVVSCYSLGKRLGVDFAELDEAVNQRVSQCIKQEQEPEKWFGDYSELQRHIRKKG